MFALALRLMLLIPLVGFIPTAFAFPCTLTGQDLMSLSHPSCRKNVTNCVAMTAADLDALPPDRQQDVCVARKFYRTVHDALAKAERPQQIAAALTDRDLPGSALSRYVTEDEYKELSDVIVIVLAKGFR
jgi:hypothetical protein